MRAEVTEAVEIRDLRRGDAAAIARLDAAGGGDGKRGWWEDLVARHVRPRGRGGARVGLVAVSGPRAAVVGYLFGQVRAFEFGSQACGWIFAVGVRRDRKRRGVGSLLLRAALERFAALGVPVVRTMVRLDEVSVLTFFRSHGFAAGPYVELELPLTESVA